MAFISMLEVRKQRGRYGVGRRCSYKDLAYKVETTKAYANKKKIVFYLTEGLRRKARIRSGNYLDVKYDPTSKEGYFEIVTTGGWKLSGKENQVNMLQLPYFDEMNFPVVKDMTEVTDIHINGKGLIFSLKNI